MKKFKLLNQALSFISLVLAVTYFLLAIFVFKNNQLLVPSILILLIVSFSVANVLMDNERVKIKLAVIGTFFTILLIVFNIYNNSGLKVESPTLLDFYGKNLTEFLAYAEENNIKVEQIYEYSDNVEKYHIISQSYSFGTELDEIDILTIVISNGPNLDKSVILPNMVGWSLEDVSEVIKENFLANVEIDFIFSDEVAKDVLISQDKRGQVKRNDVIKFVFSKGTEADLEDVSMIDLRGKSLFEANLWLRRNSVKFKLLYDFSDTVLRNNIISQDLAVDTLVDRTKDVTLVVSKGKEIIVPDLKNMSMEMITDWIITNRLNISYSDEYNPTVPLNSVISVNFEEGAKIEEGTRINLVISKGPLLMRSFNSLAEFRTWANTYDINYEEAYEYDSKPIGSIIKFSHNANTVLTLNDTVTVYISNGSPIVIPNFAGLTRTAATTRCNSLGLKCSFVYGAYSTTVTKDSVLTQNKTVGSSVISGTSVVLGLSRGPAQTFTVRFSEGQLSIGNADQTINTLRNWVNKEYPDVTFTFVKRASSVYDNDGFIHESSPIKDGSSVKQGSSYQIWITKN